MLGPFQCSCCVNLRSPHSIPKCCTSARRDPFVGTRLGYDRCAHPAGSTGVASGLPREHTQRSGCCPNSRYLSPRQAARTIAHKPGKVRRPSRSVDVDKYSGDRNDRLGGHRAQSCAIAFRPTRPSRHNAFHRSSSNFTKPNYSSAIWVSGFY